MFKVTKFYQISMFTVTKFDQMPIFRLLEEMAGTVYGEHCNEHVLKSLVGELHDSLDEK